MRGSYLIVILVLLVAVEAIDSYFYDMFWPSQIIKRWGRKGIAFIAHAGMWSDLLILPFLFAYIVDHFGNAWTSRQMVVMGIIGALVAGGNHLLLIFTQEVPDPIGWKKEWLSITIVLHFFYMGLLVAIVGLFYFCSTVDNYTIVAVSLALGVHMMAGMHVFTGMLQRLVRLPNCPDFLAGTQSLYMSAGVWVALAVCAAYARGVRTSSHVLFTALIFAIALLIIAKIWNVKPKPV